MPTPRNLAWLRSLQIPGVPEFGSRMNELISDLVANDQQLAQQTNSSLDAIPGPPPPLQKVVATPTETGMHVSITHQGDYYRGNFYHVEYADNPHFTNPFPAYSGPAREIDIPTGSKTLYVRAFGSYANSGNTSTVFHGGSTPQPVTGGTASPLGTSQGSGTGKPGQGISGFGPTPFTSGNGKAPVRK